MVQLLSLLRRCKKAKWDVLTYYERWPEFDVNERINMKLDTLTCEYIDNKRSVVVTYLQGAIYIANVKLIEMLLSMGADYTLHDTHGNNALMLVKNISRYRRISYEFLHKRCDVIEKILVVAFSIGGHRKLLAEALGKTIVLHEHGQYPSSMIQHYIDNGASYVDAWIAIRDTPENPLADRYDIEDAKSTINRRIDRIEWRPRFQYLYPRHDRMSLRTLIMLARARYSPTQVNEKMQFAINVLGLSAPVMKNREQHMQYRRSFIHLLPEEILQYLFAFVTIANHVDDRIY